MDDTENTWRCAVIANWGIGAELLRSLLNHSDISIRFVVTTYEYSSGDSWRNTVAEEAGRANILLFHEGELCFKRLEQLLIEENIDLLITHAGRRILPRSVFAGPKLGSVNFHPSLLPCHRGPSPTWWVICNKEQETGITSHFMEEGIDTGPIIARTVVPVSVADTMETVIETLKRAVPTLLEMTLKNLRNPDFKPELQDEIVATYESRPQNL